MRALAGAVGLVAAEYLLISAFIDVRDLAFLAGASWLIDPLKSVGPLVLCVATALLLLGGPGLRATLAVESGPLGIRHRPRLFYLHFASYALFLSLTVAFAHARVPSTFLSVALWVGLGLATGCSVLVLTLPSAMLHWARTTGFRVCIAALGVGVLSLAAGAVSSWAWRHLSSASLRGASALLAFLGRTVYVEDQPPTIQVGNFIVEIAAACSGVEGMGLMLAMVGTYLFAFRRELAFPAALVLLPIGVGFAFGANVLRIAALMLVGSEISVSIANHGFHSKAGWVFFCVAAVGLLYGARRVLVRADGSLGHQPSALVQGRLASYIVPELCLLATALLTGLWAAEIDRLMVLRFIGATAALAWLSRPVLGRVRVRLPAVIVGAAVYISWLVLVTHDARDPMYESFLRVHSPLEVAVFLLARVLGSVLLVPVVEELAFRGFLARWPSSADFEAVRPAHISLRGLLLSSAVFGLLHSDVIAAIVAGMAYGLLYRRTEDIGDPIVAHAVTNGLIAVEVLALGHYGRW
jgi:exosortase E/protease (VPEID-CTERM system)